MGLKGLIQSRGHGRWSGAKRPLQYCGVERKTGSEHFFNAVKVEEDRLFALIGGSSPSQSHGIGSFYCFICEKPGRIFFHARQSVLGLQVNLRQVWKMRSLD